MKRSHTGLIGFGAVSAPLFALALQYCGATTSSSDGGDVDATVNDSANDAPNADGADAIMTAPCGDAADAALCNVATEYCTLSCAIYPWQSGSYYICATPADGSAPS